MQNTTANYKLEINKPSREFECKITIGNNIYNNDELVNLTLEHTQPQEGFSIGDTISQSLDLTLLNRGDIIYSTSQIKVEIGLKIGSTIEYILMGIFNIDDIEKTDYTTKFTAYDNMIKFETPYFSSLGDKPTLKQVVNELSKITGIEFIGSLPNYTVSKLGGFTCREVLSYVASICGGNAVITRDGKFTIKSLSEIKKSIDGNNYFDYKREEVKYKIGKISCQIDENNILYKGSTGTDSMELGFENPWVTETILNDVYNKLNGLSYLGYSMKWQGDLSLDPYDIVTVTDIKNVIRKIPILSQKISYTGGLTSEIGAKGETKNKNSFSNSGSIVNKVNRAIIEQAIIKEALIEKANIKDVEAVSIRTQILEAKTAKIEEAIIDVAHISDLNAINANIQNLIATDAKFNNALINKADITELNAVVGNINIINSELANIKTLVNGNLSSENIQAGGITSDKLTIANGFITNAMIANLDVSKINAGNISTNKFRIVSDNGGIEIVGATQQFKDKNNKIRIQMGQDAKGNFNFILRGEDGTTTLIDHTGIKEKAIADNLIKGNMVATDAIGEKQINYSSLITGLNKDTNTQLIKASKVAIDFVGQSLEVAFNSLKNQADNAKLLIENHSTTIGVMQGQINTAINNTQIVKDGKTILLKDDYNRTVSKVDSINSTIGTHTTKINELTGNITSVDTKVNSIQRDLEGTKSTVSSHTNLIDGLNSKVSTQGSSIEQLKNQITLKVNSTELTTMKNELIGKIDSIEIGGRNTLLNATGNLGNTNHWSNVVLDINKKVEGCNSFKITRNNFANGNARYQGSQTIDLSRLSLKANDYITLSGWVYVDSSINLTGSSNEFAFRNYYNSSSSFEDLCVFKYTNVQKNTWTKFSVTSKVTKDSYKAGALLLSISANGLIYVSKLKLEKGSKATDFTLAPEDVDSAIGTKANKTDVYVKSEVYTKAQTDSAINIAKDSINLGVSQTYETKTNVTSKINTAKTEAVNTSKSYADNKKAEAIVQAGKDADSKVNSAKTELNNKIDLKASKTDVYTKSETYTKTETDSKIKVAKDEINLSVSNNYETKTNVENKLSNITTTLTNKIDGIQVGGTNIATETNKGVTGWGWGLQTGGKTITEVTENGIRCCKMVRDSVASTGWSFINYSRIGRNKYLPNRKYTVSFEVKASVVTSFYVGLKEGNSSNPLTGDTKTGNTVANTWTKLSATITTLSTLPSSTSQVLYLNGMNSGTGVTYIFRNLVITEGTKATSWSPAPEDVQASIDLKAEKTDVYSKSEVYTKSQTDSAINVAKDSINLGVSQTYETKSNVTSKVNSAKTEAINSAVATSKSYADTKKAEAISTASADTTNKVNSAKTELNTKIDGIQIGGRNLFLKSNIDQYGLGNWIGNSGGIGKVEGTFIDGTKTIKITGYSGIQYNSFIKLKRNTTYVYSMMMKSSGSMIVNSSNPLHMWLNTSETGGQHLEKVISASGKLEANKWTKVWVVFETPNTQDVYYMKPFVYGIDTNTVYISKVQIEEGTKPTDWTPAPEDIDSVIGTKANKTDVYAKSEVYTKDQTDSAIKVAKDEINLGVKNTYETKTNVENKISTAVNNVQIGGRNLAIGTSDSWKSASGFSGETNYCVFRHVINTKTLNVGDRLTVSFMFKCENLTNNNTARVIRIQGSGDVTGWNSGAFNSYNIPLDYSKPTQEIKINYTITITADHLKNSKWNINFRTDYITGGTIYLKELLAEKGTKASSWTPAPEDVDSAIDKKANIVDVYKKSETYTKSETDSAIKVAKDNINLSVSQTYETKTNVTSKVNTAKTEAVNTSKSYADTKKTEAINSANATTTEKLKSYSTTAQMNSAIQVAKDSITNTVSSTYAKKADVESTYATKSSLTQTANNITASFKATGGYNLIANSTGYNGTNLWSSTGATMGTAINNKIGGATNKYMYLDNGTKTTESFAFSKRFKLKANTKYTLSGWFHNFTKCPSFDVFLLSSTSVAQSDTGTSYTNAQTLIDAQNTSGSWKKFSVTFTTPASVISGYIRIDNNGYNSSGTNSNRVHWSALMLNEGEEQPWSPHPDEIYNGSTVIDASGVTINNGALTVKNKSGTTVLSGDSNGNLDITGTVKSQRGNMYVSLDYGGLTFQSAHNNEQLLRMETTSFTSNKDINGVDLNLAKQGEYISFNHINKENLNNGWSSSDGRYNFMDFWSKDTTLGSKTYKKGINVNSPMYVNKGLKLYSGTNFYADIDGAISWNNGTGTVSNLLGMYGDNGAVLGYKSGESFNARFLVTEDSHPGTGDNLISWGNYNFNGYTFHNANIVAKSLSVQGSKNCLQETKSYGARLINAYETAEYYFGDIGFGQINEEGVCYVDIDDVFLECVNTDAQYHVFTQIYNGKITSIERYKTYFIVKGEQNTEFSWELKAKRKGYEINRLDLPDIETQGDEIDIFSFENEIETDEEDLMKELTFELENLLLKEHEKDE